MTEKLVVTIMGQNVEKFLPMCFESVKNADYLIYCDGGSTDKSIEIAGKYGAEIIINEYNQEEADMNGKQRNFYLNYMKKTCQNWWALCLDADEIVEDLDKIRKFINETPKGLYSVRMRHLIGDLAHEDATQDIHYVLNRLFKVCCAESYPEVEHPVLQAKPNTQTAMTSCTTIWHLAYIPNIWEIKKKFENHMKKSNMHSPHYLRQWYYAHLFGQYKTKQFNPAELPKELLDSFGIEKDELYFANRGIELKHSMMVRQWHDYFKPESVLDLGCGLAPYLYYWEWLVDRVKGIELSDWAVRNNLVNHKVVQGDISDGEGYEDFDLITAIDVLEHLNDKQLDKTLKNMVKYGKRFLFSIPFEGDPNLLADSTHQQFRTKEDWIKLIEKHGIKIKNPPENFMFNGQLLIGEK